MAVDLMSNRLHFTSEISNESKMFFNPKIIKEENLEKLSWHIKDMGCYNLYPGDTSIGSYRWITDMAINMDNMYNPDFMFLSYANPYYAAIYTPPQYLFWEDHLEALFSEVKRFLNNTDYVPIILGTGGTYPLEGKIDLFYLENQANYSWPGLVYASVYDTDTKDLKLLEKDKSIQMIIPSERLQVMTEEEKEILPDYFLIARRGYAFLEHDADNIYRVNGRDADIPIMAPKPIKNIRQINRLARYLLTQRKKVALIILEGISCTDFKWEHQVCSNTYSWFTYLPEEFQYLTIGSGVKISDLNIFTKYCSKKEPFTQYLEKINLGSKTIGGKSNIKSAAIGSRRNLTRIASGADIIVECGQ